MTDPQQAEEVRVPARNGCIKVMVMGALWAALMNNLSIMLPSGLVYLALNEMSLFSQIFGGRLSQRK